jgi:hypothetical protein
MPIVFNNTCQPSFSHRQTSFWDKKLSRGAVILLLSTAFVAQDFARSKFYNESGVLFPGSDIAVSTSTNMTCPSPNPCETTMCTTLLPQPSVIKRFLHPESGDVYEECFTLKQSAD